MHARNIKILSYKQKIAKKKTAKIDNGMLKLKTVG